MRPGLTLAFSTRQRGPWVGRYVRHLRQTCGVERLEVLYRVNHGRWSLAELYKQFLSEASHPIVCLLHDDLRFARASAWGRRLLQSFARWPDYAVLGPAGSISLDADGMYWLPLENMVGEVFHRLEGKDHQNRYSASFDQPLPALVLDGLLLAVHKDRLHSCFDQRLAGFHFYDIAFTLAQSLAHQRGEGRRCGALTGLGVTHCSGGKLGPAFDQDRDAFLALYGSVLPRRLRPELNLLPLRDAVPAQAAPSVLVIVWYRDQRISLAALLQRLQSTTYARHELLLINSTAERLPPTLRQIKAPGLNSWAELNLLLCDQLKASAADLLLLLDNRVLPLQDWLPTMVADFRAQPQLGTLGVRLHYADTHLICHNGLQLFFHPNGQPDVANRGIHRAYPYRNALEWDVAGSLADALMLRCSLFLELGGLAGQAWLPGLELNLLAAQAGWRNAVDSRLVGYRLAEDPGTEAQYSQFLKDFASWFRAHSPLLRHHQSGGSAT